MDNTEKHLKIINQLEQKTSERVIKEQKKWKMRIKEKEKWTENEKNEMHVEQKWSKREKKIKKQKTPRLIRFKSERDWESQETWIAHVRCIQM